MTQTDNPAHAGSTAEAIDRVTDDLGRGLVAAYFAGSRSFAGATFDTLGDNTPDRFTSDDLLAASLLDVRFSPPAVRALVEPMDERLNGLLSRLPEEVDLWAATDQQLAPAYQLWEALRALPGVGRTKTSKLLARKRPRLIPILDSVIVDALHLDGPDRWTQLWRVLADERIRARIERLQPKDLKYEPSTLRLLDVAVWMRYSRSTAARRTVQVTSRVEKAEG